MRYVVAILASLLLTACNDGLQTIPPPDDLIPEKEMVSILHDLMLMEAHVHVTYESVNRYNRIMTESGNAILKQHHITKKQYETSFTYYNGQSKTFERILDQVMDAFNKESIELQQELKDTLLDIKEKVANDTALLSPTLNR